MHCNYILFDLDGTVTDPKIGITKSVAYALKYFGINIDDLDLLCKFIGPPLKESFMQYYDFDEEKANIAVIKYREYFSTKGIYENEVYYGITTMLDELKSNGKALIIATSKPTIYAIEILTHFKLIEYFDYVAGSELDGRRTKKSEVISFALSENNITNLSEVIMVGDREHDILGAKEVGIFSIGVLYGYGDRAEHENASADIIVETVNDLNKTLIKY